VEVETGGRRLLRNVGSKRSFAYVYRRKLRYVWVGLYVGMTAYKIEDI